jgi:protein-disulfide isomerase
MEEKMKSVMKSVRICVPLMRLTAIFASAVMLCYSGQAQDKNSADEGDRVVAIVNGQRVIKQRELDESIGSQLFTLQERIYALRKEALDNLLNRILIEQEARSRGLGVEAFIARIMPERVSIKQTQIEQVYAESAGRFAGISEYEAKQRIRLEMETREKLGRYKSSIAELRNKSRVEVLLAAPTLPPVNIASDGPSRGPSDAPVTIIEFSDFQCPYCKQATRTIEEVIRAYGERVRVVFKHLPLPMHAEAFKAAQAAVCADRQGKFWEYHDRLFNSTDLTAGSLKKQAADLGLNGDEFQSCLETESSRAVVVRDLQQARQADIQGTPTFVINGRVLRGAKGIDDFRKAIDEMLSDSNNSQTKQTRSGK